MDKIAKWGLIVGVIGVVVGIPAIWYGHKAKELSESQIKYNIKTAKTWLYASSDGQVQAKLLYKNESDIPVEVLEATIHFIPVIAPNEQSKSCYSDLSKLDIPWGKNPDREKSRRQHDGSTIATESFRVPSSCAGLKTTALIRPTYRIDDEIGHKLEVDSHSIALSLAPTG
jgi:hypothetical protein